MPEALFLGNILFLHAGLSGVLHEKHLLFPPGEAPPSPPVWYYWPHLRHHTVKTVLQNVQDSRSSILSIRIKCVWKGLFTVQYTVLISRWRIGEIQNLILFCGMWRIKHYRTIQICSFLPCFCAICCWILCICWLRTNSLVSSSSGPSPLLPSATARHTFTHSSVAFLPSSSSARECWELSCRKRKTQMSTSRFAALRQFRCSCSYR